MKTSNVILLAMVAVLILFIAAIPVIYNRELSHSRQASGGIEYSKMNFISGKIVKVEGISDLTIFQYDSLVVESLKTEQNNFKITSTKDTIIIRGINSASVMLYVPSDHHVIALDSRIRLYGHLRFLDAPSIMLSLRNSLVYSQSVSRDKYVSHNLNYLTITNLGNGAVDLQGQLNVEHLVLNELVDFKCGPDVGIGETDFRFTENSNIRFTACREGRYIEKK
ncbi:MAG TPA: hypothetical protein VK508_14765 [Cyclobacteriaceae bacterium]|nr:hypothetical protein [Cyclobacteriaceae bacterium]